MTRSKLHQDCLYFQGSFPCTPHKLYGVHCGSCSFYETTKQALIIKRNAPGDVLRTTALLPALWKSLGAVKITWITDKESLPLLQHNPYLSRVVSTENAAPLLSAMTFDWALNPDADFLSAALLSLSKASTKKGITLTQKGTLAPLSTAADQWFQMGLWDDIKKENSQTYPEILYQIAELTEPIEPPVYRLTSSEKEEREKWRKHFHLTEQKTIGLFTGAGFRWKYKKWTEKGWQELISLLQKAPVNILLLGGEQERERNHTLQSTHAKLIDTGSHPLRTFAVILSLCDLLVTGDTLALHLATALRMPVVALFGPTSSAEIDLYGKGEKITPNLPCLGCYLLECHRKPYCMELIKPEQVFAAVQRWLP